MCVRTLLCVCPCSSVSCQGLFLFLCENERRVDSTVNPAVKCTALTPTTFSYGSINTELCSYVQLYYTPYKTWLVICPSFYLFICPSRFSPQLSIFLCIYIYLSIYISIFLSFNISIFLSSDMPYLSTESISLNMS